MCVKLFFNKLSNDTKHERLQLSVVVDKKRWQKWNKKYQTARQHTVKMVLKADLRRPLRRRHSPTAVPMLHCHGRAACALSVCDQKTGFSAAISPNVYRSGWNLARICCDMEQTYYGFNSALIGAWAAPGQTLRTSLWNNDREEGEYWYWNLSMPIVGGWVWLTWRRTRHWWVDCSCCAPSAVGAVSERTASRSAGPRPRVCVHNNNLVTLAFSANYKSPYLLTYLLTRWHRTQSILRSSAEPRFGTIRSRSWIRVIHYYVP